MSTKRNTKSNEKIFTKFSKRIIDQLESEFNLKFEYLNKSNKDLYITGKFLNYGLRKYTVGIWGCEQSSYFDNSKVDRISVFLIHNWRLDRMYPNRADFLSDVYLTSGYYKDNVHCEIHNLGIKLEKLRKSPINSYFSFSEFHSNSNPLINYFIDWYYNEIHFPLSKRIRYEWSVVLLYQILKFISKFDSNVKESRLFLESNSFPKYTISFLATENCSENNYKWEKFCRKYNVIPSKIRDLFKYKLFDCLLNVSDYYHDMTDEEVTFRMKRGVII